MGKPASSSAWRSRRIVRVVTPHWEARSSIVTPAARERSISRRTLHCRITSALRGMRTQGSHGFSIIGADDLTGRPGSRGARRAEYFVRALRTSAGGHRARGGRALVRHRRGALQEPLPAEPEGEPALPRHREAPETG